MNLEPPPVVTSEDPSLKGLDDKSSVGRLATGAGVSILGVGIGRGLDFAKQIAMARLLGPELFGLYAIGWNFLRIVGVIAPLGLHSGVVHFATPFWRKNPGAFKSVILRSISLSFIFGWVISLVLFILAPWITTELFKEPEFLPYFRLFLFMLPFTSALRVSSSATRISQRMQYAVLSEEIAQATLNLILFIAFFLLGWQLFGAIASTVISFAIALLLSLHFLRKLFPQARQAISQRIVSERALLAFSLPASLAGIFNVVISRVDRLFLGYFWPASEVGVYQAAAQISIIMALVLSAFNMILTPMIADQYHKRNMTMLEELFRINTKWGVYCVIPVVLIILFAAEDIMLVLFGSDYVAGATAMKILTVGQFINIATGATGIMLIMTGNQTVWFRLSMMILAVNLTLNLTLIPRLGMNGAALATALTVGGLFMIGLLVVRHRLNVWPYDRRYLKGLGAGATTAALLFGVYSLNLDPVPNLLITIATAAIAFVGMLFILGLDAEDREFLGMISKRLKAR